MRNDGTGSTLYTWDYRNRLTDVTFKDGSGAVTGSIHYTYDDNNNRISQTVKNASGTVTLQEFYVYDGSNLLLVLDGSGNVKQRYFNGPNENQVLAEETNIVSSGAGDTHWALTDHEGSVRDVIDNSGSVLDHIKYDSFGNILSQSNSADAMRLAYTGQQYDSQTGLYYDHARYYDPATGRFLSTDPAGFTAGDENLYRYVGNSPVGNTDPTGLCADSSTGRGDDSGPITPDRAYREYLQAKADQAIANGTASADDLRAYRDELVANGVSLDQANADIAPLVSQASALLNQQMEDARYATGDLTALEKLQGSGSILADTYSFGLSDYMGWTQSTRYQGSAFDATRMVTSMFRDTEIMIATAGSASLVSAGGWVGDVATTVNYAGRGYLAYQSGGVIGGGINDISDGNYVSGAFKIAAGSLGVMGTLTGPLVPQQNAAEALSGGATEIPELISHEFGHGISIRAINPGGYTNNCAQCAFYTDDLLAGRGLQVAADTPKTALTQVERLARSKFGDLGPVSDIQQEMAQAGNGARGIVFAHAGDVTNGHYFNVVNQGGTVRFLDGQIGGAANVHKFSQFALMRRH